jgi:hypothetical protein
MNVMDDNPYRSPECAPSVVEQRSESADSDPAEKDSERYLYIVLLPLETWLGLAVSQAIVVEIIDSVFNVKKTVFAGVPLWLGVLTFGFLASPCAALMAYWVWRKPRSRWPVIVANLIGVSPFILALIGIWFFGLT